MKHHKRPLNLVLYLGFAAVVCVLVLVLLIGPGKAPGEPQSTPAPGTTVPPIAAPAEPADDFQLRGITLNSGADEVRRSFGNPKDEETLSEPSPHDESITVLWTSWTYDGAQVVFMTTNERGKPDSGPGEVHDLVISAPGTSTSRGIAVGDSIEKLKKAYPDLSQQDGALCLWNGMRTARLEFEVSQGLVSKINLYSAEW